MDAYETLVRRRSAQQLGAPGPGSEAIEKIIAAAVNAPDHGRLRPWRFLVIEGAGRERFGDVLAASLSRRTPSADTAALDRERKKAFRAPAIIAVIARLADHPKIPVVEQLLSAGAAAQNILLAANALGFGAVWKTGDAAYDSKVKDALGLAAADSIAGFIYIGTEMASPPVPPTLDPSSFSQPWPGSQ